MEKIEINQCPGITARQILEQNNIQTGLVGLVLIDGKLASIDTKINDGSIIEIYPIFGGG